MPDRRLTLPELTHALRAHAERVGARPPTYAMIAARVRDGEIRAERDRKTWLVKPEDVPAAAAVFGLAVAAEPRRRARTAA